MCAVHATIAVSGRLRRVHIESGDSLAASSEVRVGDESFTVLNAAAAGRYSFSMAEYTGDVTIGDTSVREERPLLVQEQIDGLMGKERDRTRETASDGIEKGLNTRCRKSVLRYSRQYRKPW